MGNPIGYWQTTYPTFVMNLMWAREQDARIRRNVNAPECQDPAARYYVAPDHRSGYGVRLDGELIAVWSVVRGRGPALLEDALWRGADWLRCADIPGLVRLYNFAGFNEVCREPNHTVGGPDIITMCVGSGVCCINQIHYE